MHRSKMLFLTALVVLGWAAGDRARSDEQEATANILAHALEAARNVCHEACERDQAAEADPELVQARMYLRETARPGGTMMRQGPMLAIERLNPEFAKRLAAAIREVRVAGLAEAGVFSAYRPPVFGVGGFTDKFYSLHAYGLAVDMFGIGIAGSPEARIWHETAARHGVVCPYGYGHRVEWNHCQPTQLQAVTPANPLRETITGAGPVDIEQMFEVGNRLLANIETAIASVVENRPVPAIYTMSRSRLSMSTRFARRSARLRTAKRHSFTIRQVMANRAGHKVRRGIRAARHAPSRTRIKVVVLSKRMK